MIYDRCAGLRVDAPQSGVDQLEHPRALAKAEGDANADSKGGFVPPQYDEGKEILFHFPHWGSHLLGKS